MQTPFVCRGHRYMTNQSYVWYRVNIYFNRFTWSAVLNFCVSRLTCIRHGEFPGRSVVLCPLQHPISLHLCDFFICFWFLRFYPFYQPSTTNYELSNSHSHLTLQQRVFHSVVNSSVTAGLTVGSVRYFLPLLTRTTLFNVRSLHFVLILLS